MYATTGTFAGGSLGGGMVAGPAGGGVAYYGGQGASMTGGGFGGVGGGGAYGYQGSAARGGAAVMTGPAGNSAAIAGGQQASFGGGGVAVGGGAGGNTCCGPAGVCGTADACGVACGGTGGGAGQLAFVGGGRGSFTTETQYRYVGAGAGEFDYVKPPPNYCICMVSSSVLLVLLGLLLWFLFKDQTPTTTPTFGCVGCLKKCQYVLSNNCADMIQPRIGVNGGVTFPSQGPCSKMAVTRACMQCSNLGPDCQAAAPETPASTCIVWGDPHITSFDAKHASYYSSGEYWIVKSEQVWIQGMYRPTHATSGLAVMKQIAFGGPFMHGHKLIVGSTQAWYDGSLVMPTLGSILTNEIVQGNFDSVGGTMQKGREGKALKVVHLNLPLNVKVQINRWTEPSEGNYVNARITMSAQPGQDGHCGNFNGNPVDDDRLQVRARVGRTGVAQADMIFPGQKTPITVGNRPDMNDCPRPKMEAAKADCKNREHKFIPSHGCLIDFCFGGAGFAGQAGAEGV